MRGEFLGKGLQGALRRATILPNRYGVSTFKMRNRLREMSDVLGRLEIVPTIPTTAATLDRHPELVAELRSVDLALHGYRHVPYSQLSTREQEGDLDAGKSSFSRHGLATRGFRAPYLSATRATLDLLRQRDFLYDSSTPRLVVSDGDPSLRKAHSLAEARYGLIGQGPAMPHLEGGLVELPVALPDDEILTDGLGLAGAQVLERVLSMMVDVSLRAGSLLVFQIHPERFHIFSEPLRKSVRKAIDRGAWRASLSEIARWVSANQSVPWRWPHGQAMALAVSGDLDAASIGDFARRVLRG